MDLLMYFNVARLRQELVKVSTLIIILPCMDPLMCFKAARLREELCETNIEIELGNGLIF